MSFNLTGSRFEMEMDAEQIDPISFRGNVVITDLENPDQIFYNNIFLQKKGDTFDMENAFLKACPGATYPPFLSLLDCLKDDPALLKEFENHILNMFMHIVMWDYLQEKAEEQYESAMMSLYRFMQENFKKIAES